MTLVKINSCEGFIVSLSTFLIKGNPVFRKGLKSLLKNPPDSPISCN